MFPAGPELASRGVIPEVVDIGGTLPEVESEVVPPQSTPLRVDGATIWKIYGWAAF